MSWLGVALIALAGFLVGGVISFWRQDHRVAAVVMGVFALASTAGGVVGLIAGFHT